MIDSLCVCFFCYGIEHFFSFYTVLLYMLTLALALAYCLIICLCMAGGRNVRTRGTLNRSHILLDYHSHD